MKRLLFLLFICGTLNAQWVERIDTASTFPLNPSLGTKLIIGGKMYRANSQGSWTLLSDVVTSFVHRDSVSTIVAGPGGGLSWADTLTNMATKHTLMPNLT
jgi:hypothetical protein